MGARQENPKIYKRLRRVRLVPKDIRTICEYMAHSGPPKVIQVDSWSCDTVDDLESVAGITARKLRVMDATFDLVFECDDARAMIMSTGEPVASSYLAERQLISLLKPKQRWSVETVRLLAYVLIWMAVWLIALVAIQQTTGFTRGENPERSYLVGAALGVVLSGSLIYALRKVPPTPSIILDESAWESRGFLKRYGVELGLGLSAISIVVSLIFALV